MTLAAFPRNDSEDDCGGTADGLTLRVRRAERAIRERLVELRPLHAGSAGILKDETAARREGWDRADTEEHERFVEALKKRIRAATRRLTKSESRHRRSLEKLEGAIRRYDEASARLGLHEPAAAAPARAQTVPADGSVAVLRPHDADRLSPSAPEGPSPGPPPAGEYGNARGPLGEPLTARAMRGCGIAIAACGEYPTIYQAVERLVRADLVTNGVVAFAFTALAVLLAGSVGIGLQMKRSADRSRSRLLLWTGLGAWLSVGAAAFLTRVWFADVGGDTPSSWDQSGAAPTGSAPALAEAAIYGLLFLAAGVFAMWVGYQYNPDTWGYRRAGHMWDRAAEKEGDLRAQRNDDQKELDDLKAQMEAAPKRRAAMERQLDKEIVHLERYTHSLIEAELRKPRRDPPPFGSRS